MSRRDEKNESNRIRKRFLFRYEHALPFDKSVAKQVQVVEAESIVCRQDMSGVGLSRVAYKRIEVVWVCALVVSIAAVPRPPSLESLGCFLLDQVSSTPSSS